MLSGGGADLEAAVVGAGPHGLAAAVQLRRAGVDVRVFGEPMSFWRSMPLGMKLRSNLSATNMIELRGPLSLAAYAAETGRLLEQPVALAEFVEYGEWVQRRAVPDVDRRLVTSLDAIPGGFEIALPDGEAVRARRVVIAGGIAGFAHRPPGFAHLPEGLISHSSDHRDPARLAGQNVIVVGGGQSAFELAVLAREAGAASVEVLVRAPRIVWLRGHSVKKRIGRLGDVLYAPTDVGPLWYSRLVERPALFGALPQPAQDRVAARSIRPACSDFVRVRLGGVRVSTGVHVRAAQARAGALALELSDGSEREADHLVLATGYRVDFAAYPFLGASLLSRVQLADGFPVLGRGLQTSLPGLHVMGAPAARSFGPIMRFVSGSWYAGRAVAAAVRTRRTPVLAAP